MKKGDVWIIEFPDSDGSEQGGTRPCIIIADTQTALILVIPLTSNLKSLETLPFTLKISKSNINGLNYDSVALIFQLRAVDKRRLTRKLGNLEFSYLDQINKNLKQLLQL